MDRRSTRIILLSGYRARLSKIIRNLVGADVYTIGYHIVYTLVNHGEDKIDNLYEYLLSMHKLSSYKFIKKYEAIMEKKRMQPIVSIRSRKGYLDYSQLTMSFIELERNLKSI